MVKDAREQTSPPEVDRDVVDFTWLKTLLARLGERLFPEPAKPEAPADSPSGRPAAPADLPPAPAENASGTLTPAPAGAAAARPEVAAPSVAAPDALTPGVPAPGVPVSDAAAPVAPDVAAPKVPALDVPIPEPGGEAAPEPAAAEPAAPPAEPRPVWDPNRLAQPKYAVPLVMSLLIGLIAMNNHFRAVDWGDDFALYMRQARALTIGNIGEVLSDNRFAVDNSGWHTFSPYSYPWGWPLLVAPLYAAFGLDYEVFKVLEVIALCVFLVAFFAIVRRRTGLLVATILTSLIGLSRSFVGATDSVLSDLPYLAFVGLSLWWMERCRERGILTDSRQHLVILGLLLAYTVNIRREGVTLLFTLVALHAAVLVGMVVRARSRDVLRTVDWRRVALPYGTFVVAVLGFQALLPTVLVPEVQGAALSNIPFRFTYYQDVIAEHFGLKDPGVPMQLFSSQEAARYAVNLVVTLAVIGVAARLLDRFEEDVALAAYLVSTSFLMLVSPYQDSRYLFTITPLLAYFAFQAVPAGIRVATSARPRLVAAASVPVALGFVGLTVLSAQDLAHSTRYHRAYHYTVNGPETPEAQEMFAAVRDLTRADDVILFFRARAMTLYSDRRAIQGSNLDQLLKRVDWYVMAQNSTYSQTLLTDAEAAARGLTKAWQNPGWVIWRVPPRLA